jgi:hypothetical protein
MFIPFKSRIRNFIRLQVRAELEMFVVQFNDYMTFAPPEFANGSAYYGVVKAVNEFLMSGKHEMLYFCLQGAGYYDVVVQIKK